jgi:hypothetical protein
MPTVECNTTTAKEHVSKAEGMICTIKERWQGLITTLPFKHIPRRMKIEFFLFYRPMVKPLPCEDQDLGNVFPMGVAGAVAAGLRQALLGHAQDIL